jgi:hypothetical protein
MENGDEQITMEEDMAGWLLIRTTRCQTAEDNAITGRFARSGGASSYDGIVFVGPPRT